MNALDTVKRYQGLITIFLALAGIATMAYYESCDTACSYLQGDIWGIDLKWIGMAYMAAIICFYALNCSPLVRAALAGGLGVEVFLMAFQVKEDVFCPFCLTFSLIVIVMFIVNYERSERLKGSWLDKVLYALGDFTWPPLFKPRVPLILFSLSGYLFVLFTFTGSATPAYGDAGKSIPSWGSGKYEVFVFSDYFCPPCQALEPQLEPVLEDILENGKVKVTFIDVPIHKPTVLFNRYYLYAASAHPDFTRVIHARRTLFQFAKKSPDAKKAREEDLTELFKKEHIAFRPFEYMPTQTELSKIIKAYNVTSTPTCIIKYPDNDVKTYVGVPEIMGGIKNLKAHLKNVKNVNQN